MFANKEGLGQPETGGGEDVAVLPLLFFLHPLHLITMKISQNGRDACLAAVQFWHQIKMFWEKPHMDMTLWAHMILLSI